MDKIKLDAKKRDVFGRKTNKGRKGGMIPAVVYGKGIKTESLWVNALDLSRMLKKSGESVIIDLMIDGKNGRNVLMNDMQNDPVTGKYMHIDFYQVKMDEKIKAEVSLEFIGESEAVKALGGVLVKSVDKIEVECLPADLPSHIDVDIAVIKTFEDHILAKDLKVANKVSLLLEPDTVVALVTPPRSEAELSQLEEKVEADVTKVEGVVKPARPGEAPAAEEEKGEAKK